MGGGGMFQSNPNYPLIVFFAGLGVLGLFLTVLGWRRDSRGWRLFTAFFTATMFAQGLYEWSLALAPLRVGIRRDLLLAIPYGATALTLLLGRALWRLALQRLS